MPLDGNLVDTALFQRNEKIAEYNLLRGDFLVVKEIKHQYNRGYNNKPERYVLI